MQARDEPGDVERLVEQHLDELAADRTPDLEALARTLHPEERGRFRATALAQEYLVRLAQDAPGGVPRLEQLRGRLGTDEERRTFDEVLADARRARERLPGELVPGMRLDGRYEIRRELGRGGMGIVYAAFDHELEREVAVKVLRFAGLGASAGWEELFRRESKTLARLASPSIVAIHDARRGAEHSYIVMDLVRGRDLLHVLERVQAEAGGAPAGADALRRAVGRAAGGERADLLRERTHARCVARILRQIAHTLEHAHGVDVIHRDLKPQNIVLLPGGEPVLLDFGLASWGQEGSEQGFRGTPEYMAPEQIERLAAGKDPRTDVYQLGLVLYEMLALRRAFPRPPQEELWPLFHRIQAGETQPLAEIAPHAPRALVAIAAKAMASDPESRYPTMRALREDLERFLARQPPKHAPLPRARRLALWGGYLARQPLTLVAAALLLAGALWLRGSPWVPPRFTALKLEGGALDPLEEDQPIELAGLGVLGLAVEAESPTWLYVFQLFGTSGERSSQFLRPVYPLTFAEYAEGRPEEPRGRSLAAGEHRLACAELQDPEPYEGLLAYSFPEESEVVAQWQRTLVEQEREDDIPVPYETALRHLEQLQQPLRGDLPGTASLAERQRAIGAVLAAEKGGPGAEDPLTWRRYRCLHRVDRRPAAGDGR